MAQNDPQPSTSTALPRNQTTESSSQPLLSEADYALLAKQLGTQFGGNASQNNSVLNTPTPSQHELWGNIMDRADTLEQNPVCVDPNSMSMVKMEKSSDASVPVMVAHQPITQENVWDNQQIEFLLEPMISEGFNYGTVVSGGPTSTNVCYNNDFPGDLQFEVKFEHMSNCGKNKHWIYSEKVSKLFIDMDKFVMANFHVGTEPPSHLYIRALPIYALAGFYNEPVKRCPNHSAESDPTNKDTFADKREHLIRAQSEFAMYEEDPQSKRLSVMIPVQTQAGSSSFSVPIKFMCLGSDVGGINRKPVKVIFTLECGEGNVIGRQSVDVRICSCPKRDCISEERRFDKEASEKSSDKTKLLNAADNLCRANSSLVLVEPPTKKKSSHIEEMILVPVAKADFAMVNKIAEALVVTRHPDKAEEISSQRRRLLRVNNSCFAAPAKKPKLENPNNP